ncbi:MAG: agmatine deiminase family protein [Verrucomicrobiota bacterium]
MCVLRKPRELGYRLPAEWEPQEAVWFAWPVREDLWPGLLEKVRDELASLYVLASNFQTVRVLCPKWAEDDLKARIDQAGGSDKVELFDYETDDVWCRDFGPIFLINEEKSEICVTDWIYNAWGGKFAEQAKDNSANAWIADQLSLRRFTYKTVLEGGAIEANGAGSLLTTEAVLLNPNRNQSITKSGVERVLKANLRVDRVYWFKEGLFGDDTDGHVDNLARFFQEDGIIIAEAGQTEDENRVVLSENFERLREFEDVSEGSMASVRLPLPKVVLNTSGERLAASYLNYLVLNGAVIVPTYGDKQGDETALEIIGDCFPSRKIIGFDCTNIIQEGGALHCLSMNQPAVIRQQKSLPDDRQAL